MPLRYISLFAGIGGFEIALNRVLKNTKCLGYSEIAKGSLKIYKKHFPNHVCLGDITKVDFKQFNGKTDLLFGGSPCKDLSSARGKRMGLEGTQSKLFFEFVRALKECKPKYWLLENVKSMRKADCKRMSDILGCEPVMLDGAWFSPQRRRRYFWCNFPLRPPAKPMKNLPTFTDILVPHTDVQNNPKYQLTDKQRNYMIDRNGKNADKGSVHDTAKDKSLTLTTWWGPPSVVVADRRGKPLYRRLVPLEYERLQGFPDNWTHGLSRSQRYVTTGNAVQIDTIVHIFKQLQTHIAQKQKM